MACVLGFILTFQLFAFIPIAHKSSIAPSSWGVLSEQTPDPPITQQVNVSVAMKQTKRMTLLSVRNGSESQLFSIEVKSPDGAIKFVKVKGWDIEQVDRNTIKVSTNDRPINHGGNLIMLMLTVNSSSGLQWSVADGFGNVLASGTVKAHSKQPESMPITKEGTDEQVKSQPSTHDNILILKVVDGSSKRVVEGAAVIIIDGSGKMLAGKITDSKGEISLILSRGNYKIAIQADGYNKLVESLEVQGDIQKTVELTHSSGITIRTTAITNE